MSNYKKMTGHYDVAVVGSDLSALILCYLLNIEHGLKTVLISAKQSLEDFRKGADEAPINLDENLQFYPSSEGAAESLDWLAQSVLHEPVRGDEVDAAPRTFDSGEFKTFLGFGERKLKTVDVIDYYLENKSIQLQLSPREWIQLLLLKYNGEILHKHEPTQILIEEGRIKSLVLNESKRLDADKFIFCSSAKDLLDLVPDQQLPSRVRQKIAKSKTFHRLNLNLKFSEVFDFHPEIHVLLGTKDDYEPVLGQFALNQLADGTSQLSSTWTYLLNTDEYENPEAMTSIVKYIKRQIKRAYPESFEVLCDEGLTVARDTHGELDLPETRVKGLENLFIGSSQVGNGQSLQAKISAAHRVYDEFFLN